MSQRSGFSLVELLIALAILMAIVAVATGIFNPIVAEQQTEVLKANLRAVRQGLLEFYNDHNRYPYEGQDEFGNVVTFLDDNTSELVQGRHEGQGKYPEPRRRYLMNMPGDPTLDTNQVGWKLVFRETFDINAIAPEELKVIAGFEGTLSDWLVTNRPFAGPEDVVVKMSKSSKDELKAPWGLAYAAHDVHFVSNGQPQPLRVRQVVNVKSLNSNYADL
jgi:type II secretory pathway pseudopilin PulG